MKASTAARNGHVTEGLKPLGLTPDMADRRHARWVNARMLAGIACVVTAFCGFLVFTATSSPHTHGVVVAAHDLAAGSRLRRTDLAVAQAELAETQAQAFVPAEALDSLEGQELLAPVATQQILARSELTTSQHPTLETGFVRMTVPVRPDTAVGGALRPGDLVTVLATSDKGKPTAQTRPVVEHVTVDQVGQADSLATASSSTTTDTSTQSPVPRPGRPIAWVTLLVPADRVTSLSLARWNGDLELIQLPPDSSPAGEP
jgi:Flp pilus assembly protein CpaB